MATQQDESRQQIADTAPDVPEDGATNTQALFSTMASTARINPREEAMMADRTSHEDVEALTTELATYCRVLKDTRPPDDTIVRFLEMAIANPDLRTLRAAKAACQALPHEERRRFHHGWGIDNPRRLRPSREDLLKDYPGKSVRRFLQLDAWEQPGSDGLLVSDADGHVGTAAIKFELRLTEHAVRVFIHEGTAHETALALLAKITSALERDWERLVGLGSHDHRVTIGAFDDGEGNYGVDRTVSEPDEGDDDGISF